MTTIGLFGWGKSRALAAGTWCESWGQSCGCSVKAQELDLMVLVVGPFHYSNIL